MNFRKGLIMALTGLLVACQVEDDLQVIDQDLSDLQSSGSVRLGKKLQNPYAVENMERAWENLKTQHPEWASESFEIAATHRYFKFIPKNEAELEELNLKYDFDLFHYPLDYEILSYDESAKVGLDKPLPQYCSIPVNEEFPGHIQYEVLAELFIPDENPDTKDQGRLASERLVDELVHEAFRITDNLSEEQKSGKDAGSRVESDWRPSGRIRVWEDRAGQTSVPVQVFSHWEYYTCPATPTLEGDDGVSGSGPTPQGGQCRRPIYRTEYEYVSGSYVGINDLEVKATRWFTTYKAKTDINGRFQCDGTFGGPATYSIKWDKYHFSVRVGTFGQASTESGKMDIAWLRDFGRAGSTSVVDRQQYYALIFQAARDYFYGDRFGLESPPRNDALSPQVKIAAYDDADAGRSHAAQYARTGGIFPSILLREWERESERVYAVTIHELAHMAHWDMDRPTFRGLVIRAYLPPFNAFSSISSAGESSAAVVESWAQGVEWVFAMNRYQTLLQNPDYQYRSNFQFRRSPGFSILASPLDDNIYTSVVIDLIDDVNQSTRWDNPDLPPDEVEGYTINQIEEAVRGAGSWNEWRDNLISMYDNPTEQNVAELFEYWHEN